MPVSPPVPTSRVAPTAKIPDDAPIAPPTRHEPLSGQHPNVSYAPPAMPTPPPGSLQQPSIPPASQGRPVQGNGSAPPRAASRAPLDSGSSFAAPVHTPLGLIAFVMIVDLALAGTGAFLLAKGLSKPAKAATQDTPAPATHTPTQKSEAAPPPPAPTPVQEQTPRPDDQPPAAPQVTSVPAPAQKGEPVVVAPASAPTKASARRPATPAPAKVSTESEINAKVMGSHTAFGHCREQAGEIHGNIDISFRVMGDGNVDGVSVVADSTGSATLGACLRDAIATWKVTPHNGAPLSFMRPFTYP